MNADNQQETKSGELEGSSETVRQTASHEFRWESRMRQSELHGDMESTAETIVPRETKLQVLLQGFTE